MQNGGKPRLLLQFIPRKVQRLCLTGEEWYVGSNVAQYPRVPTLITSDGFSDLNTSLISKALITVWSEESRP